MYFTQHLCIQLSLGFTSHTICNDRQHQKFVNHRREPNSIIVKLSKVYLVNYIEMLLRDADQRSYSYYIDVSLDGTQYKRLIDRTTTYCRSWQFLHFSTHPVQFIKLVGTRDLDSSLWTTFDVAGFKAIYNDNQHENVHKDLGLLRPTSNVAIPKVGAIVLGGGWNCGMLNENMGDFSCHQKNDQIVLQLNQPYHIGSLRLLLGCNGSHTNQYSFYIETSLDNRDWKMAVDKREESLSGWQKFEFEERPVVFVKIVGTQGVSVRLLTISKCHCKSFFPLFFIQIFYCTYFECPANPKKPTLR